MLIMMDEPHATPETGGFTTGGVVSAPIAGKVIERIAPFLGVKRIIVPVATGPKPEVDPKLLTGGRGVRRAGSPICSSATSPSIR